MQSGWSWREYLARATKNWIEFLKRTRTRENNWQIFIFNICISFPHYPLRFRYIAANSKFHSTKKRTRTRHMSAKQSRYFELSKKTNENASIDMGQSIVIDCIATESWSTCIEHLNIRKHGKQVRSGRKCCGSIKVMQRGKIKRFAGSDRDILPWHFISCR